MIAQLSGIVLDSGADFVVLDVAGVGYKVYTTLECVERCRAAQGPVCLHTHLAVRETALDLYGFETAEAVSFFELLIGVSGIGPRSALAVMNLGSIENLKAATAAGDTTYLTRVSGIGKKNAQKIVLELKDKLVAHQEHTRAEDIDTLDALRALGYSEREAREALRRVPEEITDSPERLREALRTLGG